MDVEARFWYVLALAALGCGVGVGRLLVWVHFGSKRKLKVPAVLSEEKGEENE